MPVVLRIKGYRFWFYEADLDELPHVHIGKAGKEAKYWIIPVALAKSRGFRGHELKLTFTPADFCIGESGIWFFSLMWEHGKDAEPVEFLDDRSIMMSGI
ncbi:MAG: DUF4160 domain-containing protein [bacterium]